ncbi:MAG: NAD(P)H-dependent oxidoreductase subunit E [Ancalomicrobiaceae bacterium]|nr:NAD(P)H-dependent oxidoreductase subunit E [Ancalomicrobiaceae bacterium]
MAKQMALRLADKEGALLPILHELQATFGYIDDRAVSVVADVLNLSKAEVVGTISFYPDFRSSEVGETVIRLCRAEACQSVGCEHLVAHLKDTHGIEVGRTTSDGRLTVESVYCLGNCALGPSILVEEQPFGRVDTTLLDELIAEARR